MSAIREAKPVIYYLIRRGWYDQLLRLCDGIIKKGKDPVTMFWKAFAHGMAGDIVGSIQQLESFSSGRKDMQYPISLALKYFRSRMANPDQDAIDQLNSEIAVAEDVTKEPGKVLAARFALFTGDTQLAARVAKGLLEACRGGQNPSTPFELEAACVEQWIEVMEAQRELTAAQAAGRRDVEDEVLTRLDRLDDDVHFLNEQGDIDSFMLRAKAKLIAKQNGETLNILNQVIATYPQFLPALTEKALLLASAGEWEQALDMAQRVLDQERQNIDALQILTVHALTQEYQPNDSLQKLEDLDEAIGTLEPNSVEVPLAVAELVACLCSRQPRALQICLRMLDRAYRHCTSAVDEAKVLNQTGRVHMMQGPSEHDNAMRVFREATKRDPESVQILEGLIHVQLEGGLYDDAEAQIEMLSVMLQSAEDASPDFMLLQALVARQGSKRSMEQHLQLIEDARDLFFRRAARSDALKAPFYDLVLLSPDFMILLAVEFLQHMEPPMPISVLSSGAVAADDDDDDAMGGSPAGGLAALSGGVFGSVGGVGGPGETGGSSDTVRAVEAGVDLLTNVLKLCPGIVCAYIELARCHMAQGQHEEASRVLHQCLALQPHCSAALVALAKVEVLRMNASAADRSLEQALSCDFSVRSVNLFRLVQATVRAQQGRADEAIKEIEALMALPEIQLGAAHKSLPVEEPDAFRGMGVKGGKGGGSGPVAGSSGSSSSGNGSGKMHTDMLRLTEDDRVSAFIVYASLLSKARRLKEANKVLSEAKMAFAGTAQEVQVLVAASHLAVERKDFDTAIRTLDKIAPDNPTYKRAQMIKAEVYLVYQRDKEKFVNCYNQLVGRDGSPQNFSLLGEAYLRILNPEKAVEALEEAYKMDQSNSRLRARIGRALVATHEYHRAVRFYEDAIREVTKSAKASASNGGPNGGPGGRGGNGGIGGWGSDAGGGASSKGGASASVRSKTSEAVSLSHDLAKLFLKLGKPESSSRVLEGILHNDHRDIFDMRQDVATLLLLVEVHKINAPKEVVDTLLKAKAVQRDLLNQVRSDVTLAASSEVVEAERLALSAICESLGACYVAEGSGSDKDAEAAFRESIQHNPHNVRAMIGLAKIHKRNGEADLCQAQCQKVISAEPSNEEATIMLSELLFATASEPAGAVKPLQTLLQDHPNNYKALANLITLLRKGGQLEEVPAYITAAEKKDRRSASHAGLHFCKGLYARHTNAVGQAISEFNLARRDEAWGHDALVHMIELYLNPDQEGVWQSEEGTGDAGDKESGGGGGGGGGGGSSSSGSVLDEATIGNIQAAEILLKELQPKARDPMRFRVLESYCALASRQKHNVDRAMQTFIDLLETDQDYLPAVLGMATGFMVEKAAHKARNLLKRVAKMEQAHHDGEDFQKATLLLAKFSVDKSKYDLAQELCTKCLATDKSCSQAWEIMALIKEKDQDYAHAADCYEKAWKLEFEAAAAVGFKLAFCYLKSKKYVEAIDVAERVLDQYPDYPRIREEILKKALLGIRSTT